MFYHPIILKLYFQGYDGMFLLNYLVKNTVRHDVIFQVRTVWICVLIVTVLYILDDMYMTMYSLQGSKIMSIIVQSGLNMRVIRFAKFFPDAPVKAAENLRTR